MKAPRKKAPTVESVGGEQYGLERRGHDGGELLEMPGGEESTVADDYSTTGLFRDDNFGRDSCGSGDARPVDRSWDGAVPRPPELYHDTAESDFTVRTAEGLDQLIETEVTAVEEELKEGEELQALPPIRQVPKSPIARKTVVK